MKKVSELVDKTNSTWDLFMDWCRNQKQFIEVLSVNREDAENVLYQLQITSKSMLGTVIFHTGGILLQNGWIRILGSGNQRLPSTILEWNDFQNGQAMKYSGALLVAYDVVGGFFAINGGAFDGTLGDIFYLAPDTLEWENLQMSYSEFVHWVITGDVDKFYESFRWENWKEDLRKVDGDQGILIYPYLWAEGAEINLRSKSVVPIQELWELNLENRRALGII